MAEGAGRGGHLELFNLRVREMLEVTIVILDQVEALLGDRADLDVYDLASVSRAVNTAQDGGVTQGVMGFRCCRKVSYNFLLRGCTRHRARSWPSTGQMDGRGLLIDFVLLGGNTGYHAGLWPSSDMGPIGWHGKRGMI